jgi:predicted DNA-binding antitoxin AbrB/MazE fold protein
LTAFLIAGILTARVRDAGRWLSKRRIFMVKTIQAVYENGVLRPLEKLDLKESQRLKLTLEVVPSVVDETRTLIRAKPEVVQEVAEGDEYLPEGSGT